MQVSTKKTGPLYHEITQYNVVPFQCSAERLRLAALVKPRQEDPLVLSTLLTGSSSTLHSTEHSTAHRAEKEEHREHNTTTVVIYEANITLLASFVFFGAVLCSSVAPVYLAAIYSRACAPLNTESRSQYFHYYIYQGYRNIIRFGLIVFYFAILW